MSYSSHRTDRQTVAYFVKAESIVRDSDGDAVSISGTELPLESDSYSETEDGFEFYADSMLYFTTEDGKLHDFQSEEKAMEWLEANGYSSDY